MKNYSPKLREAMGEIEEIMKHYDIGGFVILNDRDHAEFKYFIDSPTWSNVRRVKDGEALHLKLHVKSDKAKTESTISMLYSVRDLCGLGFLQMDKLANQIEHHVNVEHLPFGPNGISNEDRK
jgi:hypothetical protein